MLKLSIIMAIIGHILCGISDCLMSYSRKGRLDFKDIQDSEKMAVMFRSRLHKIFK